MNEERKKKYREYQREYQRRYRQTNEKYQQWRREWANKRQKEHGKRIYAMRIAKPNEKIAARLRTRVSSALRGLYCSAYTEELLGISLEGFRKFLALKFTEGMDWNNYGKWHADHIVPLSTFDLSDELQLRQAFHYTNVQPLWAKDNLHKYTKVSN